jgi:hypothetical protein
MTEGFFNLPEGDMVALGHVGGETAAEVFKQAFLDLWERLPPADRRDIREFWRTHHGLAIAVVASWPGRGGRSAECIEPGDKLRYFADHVAIMPDYALRFTTAHELAHVYLLASGDPAHSRYLSPDGREADAQACETGVRETMKRWGLYDTEAVRWAADNLR